MSFLESAKQYTGSDLETIFFRPILSGDSARELGVRVLYNMPVPTTIQLWDGQRNVLQKYSAAGWTGGNAATKLQKTISLGRVKAELGFSAADYFSLVYEKIAARADVNMDDLTGTELTLLEVLARKVGTPVPKDEIYQKVLGRAMQRYDRAIDVHVSSIRHKLAAVLGTSVAIESIRGVGYQFVVR